MLKREIFAVADIYVPVKRRATLEQKRVDEIAAVVHDNVVYDEQPARVGSLDHVLQIRQTPPMRRDAIEIPPRITVKLAVSIEHDG